MRAVPDLTISRLHYPVTALGFGQRLGVWVQGCDIGCVNCVSRDTWEHRPANWSIAEVVDAACVLVGRGEIDGVTLTGGEPTEQWSSVAALVDALRASFSSGRPFDVLMFTGVQPDRVEAVAPGIADRLDAMVAGPYLERFASDEPLRATSNQRLEIFTPLGAARYSDLQDMSRNRMQLAVDEDGVHLIGLPRPREMTRITEDLAAHGIRLRGHSWSQRDP